MPTLKDSDAGAALEMEIDWSSSVARKDQRVVAIENQCLTVDPVDASAVNPVEYTIGIREYRQISINVGHSKKGPDFQLLTASTERPWMSSHYRSL